MRFSLRTAQAWAWASLIANAVIVVTGALVRLTGSGLGCPTWPRCTEDSFVPHGELGIHGAIEFGNRLVTYLVAIAAIGTVLVLVRSAARTRFRVRLAAIIALGVPLQGVVGGITVLTDLNPWVVALHLLLSMTMIALATWLVVDLRGNYVRIDETSGRLLTVTYVVLAASIYIGTIVTGSGPHAGDADAVRNGLDSVLWSRLHALAVWFFLGLLLVLLWRLRNHASARLQAVIVALVALAQGLIGYIQYFTGLPEALVLAHLAGASVLLIVGTWMLATLRTAGEPTQSEPVVTAFDQRP